MLGISITKRILMAAGCLTVGCFLVAVNAEDKSGKTITKTSNWPVKFTIQEDVPAATQKKVEIKQPFYPALTGSELKIEAALQSKVDFEFPDVTLSKVLATLQSQHGVNIYLSAKALEDEGITADHPVNIAMKGIPLKSALELILKPLGLTYVVDGEVLKITTPYEANRTFQVRIYPVADLCETPEDFLALQDVIRNAQLGNWKPNGIDKLAPSIGFDGRTVRADNYAYEGGTISVLPQIQSLVISQNYDTHNAIVDFLSLLRDVRKDQQRQSTEKKDAGIPR